MNEQDKLEVKDLLKQALDERSKEYTNKKKFKIYRKDFRDFLSIKLNKIVIPIFLAIIIALTYQIQQNMLPKEIVTVKEVLVEKIVKEEFDKSTLGFHDLNEDLQAAYVLKSKFTILEKRLKAVDKINPKESTNSIVLNKKISYLQANLEKTRQSIKKQKYNSVSCYDTGIASKNISAACKKKLKVFFKNNKETSIRYQIIPLLDKKDAQAFASTKSKSKRELLHLGLSRARVLEAAWLVKDYLGKDTLISYVNYIAQSKHGRGIIIRAYK